MTWETLDTLASDPTVIAHLEREALLEAIRATHQENGVVTARTIRAHIQRPITPHRVGAVISALVKRGVLVATDQIDRSGNTAQRNGNRLMPVYTVNQPECLQ